MTDSPRIPQRLTFVTLGTRDIARARAFYAAWGWREGAGASDEFAQFDMGGVRFALYQLDLLGAEAAPGSPTPLPGWNGVTLAVNVTSRVAVDDAYRAAVGAGAQPVGAPVEREWGGYSAYVCDPEGQRWEIAWLPVFIGDGDSAT
jgi:predicted lactoylglutathione lyase